MLIASFAETCYHRMHGDNHQLPTLALQLLYICDGLQHGCE